MSAGMRKGAGVAAVVVAAVAAAMWAGAALAHGAGFERSGEPAEVVRFFYIGGEPMAYATIKVFRPAGGKAGNQTEYQTGFADEEGRFAFVPNAPGNWRVEASDGMGHRAEAVVPRNVGGADAVPMSSTPSGEGASAGNGVVMAWKAALGLSLILNLALLAQWAVRRARRDGEAARAHQ